MLINKKNTKILKYILLILLLILLIIIYVKIKTIKSTVNIIFISFILAYALKPLRDILCDKFRIKKRISSILIILSIIISISLFIYILIPSILRESYNFGNILDNVDNYVETLSKKMNINNISFFDNIYSSISDELNLFLRTFSDNLFDNLMAGLESLVSLAIIPIVTYYFLVDGDLIFNKVLLVLPTEKRVITKKFITHIDKVLSRYIISQLILSIIIGVLTSIALFILDVKFALLLGVFNGVLNIVPYFGPIIGGIPAVFVALMESPNKALWTLLIVFIIQQIEGNILSPKITGDSTNMHPIIIIILLLIGEKLGGFIGMILIVPIGVIIKVIYEDINDYLF
ncbi:AI-2E family transporter [Clostridium sp. AL.422]|uniref:AI-2E family transporter n=1 Tax=Clostridium TaxID=1485 RepID=UPI00293DBBAD|nr:MULTISPECIES: AI-2E family transporter [unclassified Clostridium]MDV4152336.1 AI-2E family transporter [Clostridium sp. AL.422]